MLVSVISIKEMVQCLLLKKRATVSYLFGGCEGVHGHFAITTVKGRSESHVFSFAALTLDPFYHDVSSDDCVWSKDFNGH